MPRTAISYLRLAPLVGAAEIGRNQHRRRLVWQALQLIGKGRVNGGQCPALKGNQLKWAIAGPVALGRLAPAHKVIRMRYRGAPMIGETLEMSQGKSRQILGSDTDNAKPAQNIEQKTRLFRTQPGAQIHPRQT